MNRRSAFRSYFRGLLLGAGGLLLLVVAANALINPFNLYAGPRRAGVNDYKYELDRHSRLSKAAEVRRLKPDCLILGSSRAQIGLDPAHPAWRDCRAYNLAQNGGTLYEAMRYFQHAAAVQRPQDVVLALDLLMFNAYRPLRQPGYLEERLLTRADGSPNPAWQRHYADDVFTSLLSWRALDASHKTVFPPYLRQQPGPENGYWEYRRFGVDYLKRRGQHEYFRRTEQAFLEGHWFPPPRHVFDTRDPDAGVDTYDYLRSILRMAHREPARLTLVVSPAHARLWEALYQGGLWTAFEDWKRELVRINDEEARRARRSPFAVWDFSGFNRYTTEAVPAASDRDTQMRWYWESSHYRKELGDVILDRVLGYRAPGREQAADFGVPVTPANLEAHLAGIRKARARWRATHAAEVAEIEALAREILAKRR